MCKGQFRPRSTTTKVIQYWRKFDLLQLFLYLSSFVILMSSSLVEEEEEKIFVAARARVFATLERRPFAPATTSMDDGRFGMRRLIVEVVNFFNVFSNIFNSENLFWTVKSTYMFPDETFVVVVVVLLLVVEVVVGSNKGRRCS